ncbi:MAG: hypothetical protein GDA43_07115 [Hormoscilla sp. SP5CHS1]|nr:hypothetical protein [Hormoscilla sp. SP12CHS1]MBC6453002.1 hypothetical protein [Hormoscilla sp. SP5CHS1]
MDRGPLYLVGRSLSVLQHRRSSLYRVEESENLFYWLKSPEDWSLFRGSFLVGGAGGAMVVYFILQNFPAIDLIFRGLVN